MADFWIHVDTTRPALESHIQTFPGGPWQLAVCDDLVWTGEPGEYRGEPVEPERVSAILRDSHDLTETLADFSGPIAGVITRGDSVWVFRDRLGAIIVRMMFERGRLDVATAPVTLGTRPNGHRIHQFMAFGDDDFCDDFMHGVERVRPAEIVQFADTRLRARTRYWPAAPGRPFTSVTEAATGLKHALRAGLPQGEAAYDLSSGLDSAAIVALAVEQGARPDTFSMFSSLYPRSDERDGIDTIARQFGLSSSRMDLDAFAPLSDVGPIHRHPFGPLCHPNVELDLAFRRFVRSHGFDLHVTGGGGNHVLAISEAARIRELVAARDLRALRRPRTALRQLASLVKQRIQPEPDGLPWPISRLFGWEWELMVRQQDAVARAAGVRIAQPFMTPATWEWALRCSPAIIRHSGRPKGVLRHLLGQYLPSAVVDAPKVFNFSKIAEKGLFHDHRDDAVHLVEQARLDRLCGFDVEGWKATLDQRVRLSQTGWPRNPDVPTVDLWRPVAAALWLAGLTQDRSSTNMSDEWIGDE